MPDIPILRPKQWDLEDDRGRSHGSATSRNASRQRQRTGTPSGFEPYSGFDQFAAQQEGRFDLLIEIDPMASGSLPTTTETANRPKPRIMRSLLDLDIDDIALDDNVLDNENFYCEQCEIEGPGLFACNVCNACLCAGCWDMQMPHRKNKLGPGGIPHEKTPPDVAKKVSKALEPPTDSKVREKLYEDDELTAWFGINRLEDCEQPSIQDFGRYGSLMQSTEQATRSKFLQIGSQGDRDCRTPSLVSFVGQTGAGKSTLIKLVIDLLAEEGDKFLTPVVGTSGSVTPTSEDVHLYLDPRTARSDAPLLYADCEGLDGGEREPLGAVQKRKRWLNKQHESIDSESQYVRSGRVVSERELIWADSPRTRSRDFVVANLYPRLLYTFSDVIVFVLKNPRVIESVFDRLVSWAAAALETASNQPVLPHCIIALNASENDIPEELWDVSTATNTIFESLDESKVVNQNETFKKYAQFWRERQREVENVEQLMLSYYSSIQIIRIPTDGRPNLIKQQIEKLYDSILRASSAARERKANLRMLLDAEELQSYLNHAFNHFANTLNSPFDFVQASFSNSPIPANFGGNILKLAIRMTETWKDIVEAKTIFQELSYMVASCIMFDSARMKNKGSVSDIFPQYLEHLDDALENFCLSHWPCEFIKSGGGERCVNVRSGHGSKGHQSKDGRVFAAGDYVTRFSFEGNQEEFRCNVYFRLEELLERLHSRVQNGESEEQAAAQIHSYDVMPYFYRCATDRGRGSHMYNSHTACLCCLFEIPEHALPCGHVICTACLKVFGHEVSPTAIDLYQCPIDTGVASRFHCWRVLLVPKTAGIRILTLDGGGIKGIAEVEVLRLIEIALGGKLAIQNFFDLIIGTSTGGLIALGLGVKNWSVQECREYFTMLCDQAFTRRRGGGLPLLSWLINNYHHSKYETTGIESALKQAFSEDELLFGGRKMAFDESSSPMQFSCKTAVTSTSAATNSTVLLTNYNRCNTERMSYHFRRPENSEEELKIWEAGRATSAAPVYFRSFHHEGSKQTFLDGAINCNNPIRIADKEWKMIWQDRIGGIEYPDVILSLGTSYSSSLHRNESEPMEPPRRGVLTHGKFLAKIAKDVIHSSLNCEKVWNEYIGDVRGSVDWSRFIRLNPEIDEVPKLDEVHRMKTLQETVRNKMKDDPTIKKVAARLICSCFYFELVGSIVEESPTKFTATGAIFCRLVQNSKQMEELGWYIHNHSRRSRDPPAFFALQEKGGNITAHTKEIPFSESIIGRMITDQIFKLPSFPITLSSRVGSVEISLSLDQTTTYLISGFPRSLFQDEKQASFRHKSIVSNPNRWAARSRSNQMRRLRWDPPKESDLQRTASLASYKDQHRLLGDASAEEINKMTISLTDGPSPPSDPPSPSSTRLTRFFGRANRPTNKSVALPSPTNPEAVDTVSGKIGNEHWYSNLLRRGAPARSIRSDQPAELLPRYGQSPVELHSSPIVAELMADHQQPVELPASLPSPATEREPSVQENILEGNESSHPPQSGPAQPSQSQRIHMPTPILLHRPPTNEDTPQYVVSVSPVDSAITDRARSVVSWTSPSPDNNSTSPRNNIPAANNWENL